MKKIPRLLKSSVYLLSTALFFISTVKADDTRARMADEQKTETTAAIKLDNNIVAYTKVSGISGNINSIGSDTLNNLMTFWAEKFSNYYPNVKIQVEGKGSGTAPPALISGTSQIGPMSREMKASELDDFKKKFGYEPTQIRVAVDALGVFVNKDNPLKNISMQQIDAIFSKTRKLGGATDILTWGDIGLTGEWAKKPISLYGRNSASGTYGFFKEHAMENGDFKDTVKEQPGSASVVQSIGVDKYAIGYSGIGYKTAGVNTLNIKGKEGTDFITGNQENAYSGEYPLSRFLYLYINKAPGKEMDPLVKEFLKMVLSKNGQEVVVKDGYYPLPLTVINEESSKLN